MRRCLGTQNPLQISFKHLLFPSKHSLPGFPGAFVKKCAAPRLLGCTFQSRKLYYTNSTKRDKRVTLKLSHQIYSSQSPEAGGSVFLNVGHAKVRVPVCVCVCVFSWYWHCSSSGWIVLKQMTAHQIGSTSLFQQ